MTLPACSSPSFRAAIRAQKQQHRGARAVKKIQESLAGMGEFQQSLVG